MSRTFRRKGYEKTQGTTWHRKGDKVAGYYTITVWEVSWDLGYQEYRAPTDHEYGRKYWEIHGDNHRNEYTPARGYRQFRMHQNRQITRQELHKYMVDQNYEPMVQEEPISHWWDWR